jgi:hypothetical protein
MLPQYTTNDITRFWSKVDRSGACWLWTASTVGNGYGKLSVSGVRILAHRFAYLITYGVFPSELCVLHNCDTPACVNPKHLWLGTYADNVHDMMNKGRRVSNVPRGEQHFFRQHPELMMRGEQHGRALLTNEQVREMRKHYTDGESIRILARRYSVSKSTVYHIVIGDTWIHLL